MDLYELVKSQLNDAAIGRLAARFGESSTATREALLGGAVPAVLGGLAQRYSGDAGAAALLDLLRSGGHDGSILVNLEGALGGGAQTDALLNSGKGLLGGLLGGRSDPVEDFLAARSGMRRSSAGSLLAIAVPLVLNAIGRQVQTRSLDAGGIAASLASVPARLRSVAMPGLDTAMGVTDFAAIATNPASGTIAAEPRRSAVWPWLLVPAVALALFFSLRSCQQNALRTPPGPGPAPKSIPAPIAAVPGTTAAPTEQAQLEQPPETAAPVATPAAGADAALPDASEQPAQ